MAASLKISELNALTTLADDDLFLVTDTSATTSKKATYANLKAGFTASTSAALGIGSSDTTMGAFTGSAVGDNLTVKAIFQALATKIDAKQSLLGVSSEVTHLGTFSGSTIADSANIKAALQSLETATELRATAASPAFTGNLATLIGSADHPVVHRIQGGFPDVILRTNGGDVDLNQNEGRLLWEDAGGGAVGAIKMVMHPLAPMRFFTKDITAAEEKMRITTDGRVGIGKTVPLAKLHVDGSVIVEADFPDFDLRSGGERRIIFQDAGGGAEAAIKSNGENMDIFIGGVTAADRVADFDTTGLTLDSGKALNLDSVALTTVQTSGESFADNDTSLMTSAAIDDRINASGGSTLTSGVTAGTVSASKAVIVDANKDITGFRNLSITGNLSVQGTTTQVDTVTMEASNAVVFEGATADASETTLTIIDPDADRTIKLPNQSGCIPVLAADSATAITATPEELNILDGVTSTAAELNILDGVTATAAELNILDGVTATAAELNILDGVTSTAAELNILDGVTSTAAELNLLDGVTATTAELNYVDGVTSAIQTQLDAKLNTSAIPTAATLHLDDVRTALGIASEATHFGTFTGSTISDNGTLKDGLQELETATEARLPKAGGILTGNFGITKSFADFNLNGGDERRIIFGDSGGSAEAGIKFKSSVMEFTGGGIANGKIQLKIGDGYIDVINSLKIDGTAVTSTAAELNILDGVTSTAAELNILDGVTSTAAELNILDGVTSTAAELNLLDGVTATTAEINYLDGVTSNIQTQIDATVSANNTNLTGTTTIAAIDLSGDIDCDGTANLDAVDIDGDVDLAGDLTFSAAKDIQIVDNNANALEIAEAGNNYMVFDSTDNSEQVEFGVNVSLDAERLYFTHNAPLIRLPDNKSAALTIENHDGSAGEFVVFTTSNSGLALTTKQAHQHNSTLTVGEDDTGYDVKFFGATASAYMLWDESADDLILAGDAGLVVPEGQFTLGSTAVTSTAAELNILDGVTSTAAELNILDGVTSTTAELNILDGVTATTAELNILDGVTSTAAELNLLDGITAGTASASLAVILDSNKDLTGIRNFTITGDLSVAGSMTTVDTVTMTAQNAIVFEGATADSNESTLTIIDPTADRTIKLPNQSGCLPVLAADSATQITSTPEELNILDGVTSTAAELNLLDGITAGTVSASLAVIVDSDKDVTGFRNVTLTGELDAATLDISGDADIDGTANLDAVDIDGDVDIAGSINISAAQTLSVVDNQAQALAIMEGSNNYINIRTSDSSERVEFNKAVKFASTLDIDGNLDIDADIDLAGDLTFSAVKDIKIVDNDAAALEIKEGNNAYLTFNTTNSAEWIQVSKLLKVDANIGVTNQATDLLMKDNTAAALDITESSNSYLKFDTTNSSELITTGVTLDIANGLKVGGTAVTSTAAELNILDGVTSTAAELNILDGVTSTTAELNILDGVTSTASELNLLDGITAGTVSASLAVIVDSDKDITGFRNVTLTGELDAATLDISGNADIDGTTNLDAVDIDGDVDLAGDLTFSAAKDIQLIDNNAAALEIAEAGNNYMTFVTTDSSEKVEINQNLSFNKGSGLGITSTAQNITWTIKDDHASSLMIAAGGTGIIKIDTQDDAETIFIYENVVLDSGATFGFDDHSSAKVDRIQASGSSFADNDTSIMTSAAIEDKIQADTSKAGGTWTATLEGAGGAPGTKITATGNYARMGDIVLASVHFNSVDTSSYSGAISISGLPVTSKNTATATFMGQVYNDGMISGATDSVQALVADNGTTISFLENANSSALNWGTVGAGKSMRVQVQYIAA